MNDESSQRSARALFAELAARYHTPLRGRAAQDREAVARWQHAQHEMFWLAQRVAADAAPAIQARLDLARREVVRNLYEDAALGHELRPVRMRRPIRWCEIVLTPELEGNLALTGSKVGYSLAQELREAHRAQVEVVQRMIKEA